MNRRDYLIKYKPISFNMTHVFMNGGKINTLNNDEFLNDYVKSINNNINLSIVELVPKCNKFKMFFDIDIKNKNIREKYIDKFTDILKEKCVICISNSTTSYGIHIICSDLIVTSEEAIQKANELNNLKIIDDTNNLKIIDTSVYKTGLRMIYSHKKEKQEYYYPKYIWDEILIELDETFQLSKNVLKVCSIFPITQSYNKQITQYPKVDNCTNNCKSMCKVDNEKTKKILDLSFIHEEYRNIIVTKKFKQHNYIILNTKNKYCMNIKKEHKNAYIYFVINNKKEIIQKCFCNCETCISYKGYIKKIPYKLYYELRN